MKNLLRIMEKGKKKPSIFIYTRINIRGRKVVVRRRTIKAEVALRKAIA